MTELRKCLHCQYCTTDSGNGAPKDEGPFTKGICRRHAPNRVSSLDGKTGIFPLVWGHQDFCGDYVPRA